MQPRTGRPGTRPRSASVAAGGDRADRGGGTTSCRRSSRRLATRTGDAAGRSTRSAPAGGTRCRSGISRRGGGRRGRLQPADARARRASLRAQSAHRLAGSRADVLDTPSELDGTADLLYTGRGSLVWLQDLEPGPPPPPAARAGGPLVLSRGPPDRVAVRRRRGWQLDRDRLRLLRRAGGIEGLGAAVHRSAVDPRTGAGLEVRPILDARRGADALAGAGLRIERVAEHPTDWWGGHADVKPEERGRIPLSYSVVARRG